MTRQEFGLVKKAGLTTNDVSRILEKSKLLAAAKEIIAKRSEVKNSVLLASGVKVDGMVSRRDSVVRSSLVLQPASDIGESANPSSEPHNLPATRIIDRERLRAKVTSYIDYAIKENPDRFRNPEALRHEANEADVEEFESARDLCDGEDWFEQAVSAYLTTLGSSLPDDDEVEYELIEMSVAFVEQHF